MRTSGAALCANCSVSCRLSTDRSQVAIWQPAVASCMTSSRPIPYLIVGLLLLAGSFGVSLIPMAETGGSDTAVDVPGDQQAMTILQTRCATCHSRTPSDPNFSSPPNGFVLDTLDDATQKADLAFQRMVVDRTMPLGNLTAMTEQERAALGAWLKAAAKLQ